MDIHLVKNIIQDFAVKYNFIQNKDIILIENSDFDVKNYNNLFGKKFVSLSNYNDECIIKFGTIFITIDRFDEEGDEESYGIDKDILFQLNIADFLNKEILLETMIKECEKYQLI